MQQHLLMPIVSWHIGPVFKYGAVCYHYETRTITETHTDSNGNSSTTTRQVTERVNTWSGNEEWIYSYFDDNSGELADEIRRFQTTKIQVGSGGTSVHFRPN